GANALERQSLTFTGSPTGGTFTLTLGSITTPSITYSTNLSTLTGNIQTQLNTLFGTGNARAIANSATQVDILIGGTLAGGDIPLMTVASSLTGGTTPSAAITAVTDGSGSEVQQVNLTGIQSGMAG